MHISAEKVQCAVCEVANGDNVHKTVFEIPDVDQDILTLRSRTESLLENPAPESNNTPPTGAGELPDLEPGRVARERERAKDL